MATTTKTYWLVEKVISWTDVSVETYFGKIGVKMGGPSLGRAFFPLFDTREEAEKWFPNQTIQIVTIMTTTPDTD